MKLTHCPSCSFVFTGPVAPNSRAPVRQPHILKCGHSFCGSCILQWLKKGGHGNPSDQTQICCPLCSKLTCVESGIRDLPVNVYLTAYIVVDERTKMDQHLEALEKLGSPASRKLTIKNETESDEKMCKMCLIKEGSCKCVECDSTLCNVCFEKVHKLSAAIRNHKPVPLEGRKSRKKLGESTCTEHGRAIEYFCIDDSTSICSKCYIVGDHKGHTITSFEEMNKQVLDDIENEIETSRIVLGSLMTLDKKIISAMPNIKVETKSIIEDVKKSFVHLHALLQNREMDLIASVTQAYQDFISSLDEERQAVEKSKIKLGDAFKNAQKLLNDTAMIIDGQAILEVLKEARKTPCLLVKTESSSADSLTWEESNGADLLSAIQRFGSICGKVESKFELKNIEEAPEHIEKVDKTAVLSSVTLQSTLSTNDKQVSIPRSSSIDTGEDVIIESNTDVDEASVVSRSSKSVASATSDVLKGGKVTTQGQASQQEFIRTPVIKGEPQKVVITHIRSPKDFFVQLIFNKRKFETLTHNINNWCGKEAAVKHIPVEIEKNMLVIARYSGDKVWYRARILSNVPTATEGEGNGSAKVRVLYIDFGNDEYVAVNELRSMQARFMKYPEFAVHCSLFDIAPYEEESPWSIEAIQEFHRLTQNKVFLQHTIGKHNEVYETDLVCIPNADVFDDAFVSIRDVLVFLQVARFNTHSSSTNKTSKSSSFSTVEFIAPTRLENGSTVEVLVTNVISPWNFHVTCEGCERDYYLNMMSEMHAMYNKDATNIYSLFYPRPNMVCSVKVEDKKWYRARVLESPKCREVTVYLVDTGAVKVVSHEKVKKLHRDFIKLPAQAIPCTLADVGPLDSDSNWSTTVQNWCKKTMSRGNGFARIVSWNKPTEIVLWLGKNINIPTTASINYMLVEMGVARSTGLASAGVAQEYMANITSSVDFNRQPQKDKNGNVQPSSEFLPAARNRGSDSSSSNSTIMSVPRSNTVLSQHSANLKRGQNGGQPRGKAASKQKKQKKAESKSQPKSHRLIAERKKIQSEIERALIASGESPSPASIYLEVEVCNFISPSEFYVRMKEKENEFHELVDAIQAEYRNSKPPESPHWKINDFCAVKIPEDGMWYRGNIKSIMSDAEYEVEIVDYGFIWLIKPEDMRHLTYELGARMDCAAVRCHLADLVPAGSVDVHKWSRTAVEFVSANLKDKKLFIKQEGHVTDLGLAVDVILQDMVGESAFEPAVSTYRSLRRAILEKGLAMPGKGPAVPPSPDTVSVDPFKRIIYGKKTPIVTEVEKPKTSENESDSDFCKTPLVSTNSEQKSPLQMREAASLSVPPYPLPRVEDTITVLPTYIDLLGIIYAQPVNWSGKLAHLSSELQRVYNHTTPDLTIAWKVPQLCVASFPDDSLWYRALITQIEDNQIQVRYIDYGNSAWVDVNCLREILPEFATIHGLAYYCILDEIEPNTENGQWPVPVLEYMHGLCVDKECDIVVKEVGQDYLVRVDLHKIKGPPGGSDLGAQLVSMGYAVNCGDISDLYKQSQAIGQVLTKDNPYEQQYVGTVGDTFQARLTHVELPNLIYLQRTFLKEPESSDFVKAGEVAEINSSVKEFQNLQQDLQTCKCLQLSTLPDKGLICLGQYSFDKQWYRAVVVEKYVQFDSCLVVFVDYGTPEVVPRACLKLLPSEFWSFPAQGLRCYFNIVPPGGPNEKWTRKSLTGVINVLSGKDLTVRILKNSPLVVELLEERDGTFHLAYELLIENRLALLPGDIDSSTVVQKSDPEDEDVILEDCKVEIDESVVIERVSEKEKGRADQNKDDGSETDDDDDSDQSDESDESAEDEDNEGDLVKEVKIDETEVESGRQVKEVWVDVDYNSSGITKEQTSESKGDNQEKCEEEKLVKNQESVEKQKNLEDFSGKEENEEDSGVHGSVGYETGEQETMAESSGPVETWS